MPVRHRERRLCTTCERIIVFRPEQAPDFIYCGRDGTKLENAPKCIACDWTFYRLSDFCPKCGVRRNNEEAEG